MQRGDDRRHEVGAQCRRDTKAHRADEPLAGASREVANILDFDSQPAGAGADLATDRRQFGARRAPLDQDHAQPLLERAELLAQARLGDIAGLRGPTEMLKIGDCNEILKLA